MIVIIIILLLICCTLGGLIFLNKEKEDLDINDSTVINFFNIFRINQGCWLSTNYEKLNTDNKYKLRLAYEHLDIEFEKIYAQYSGECVGTCVATKQEVTKAYKDNNKLYIETSYEQDITIKYELKKDSKNNNYIFVKLSRV